MHSKTRTLVWYAALPLIALLLACGGDSNDADESTPTGADAPSTSTASKTSTPGTSATKSFTSSAQGYTVLYPASWQTLPNYKSGSITADAFIAPEKFNGQAANITVYCDKAGAGTTLDTFVTGNVNGLKQNNVNPSLQNKVPVGSAQGQMMTYSLTSGGVSAEYAQVLWSDKRCGWLFTLTSPVGHRDAYVSTLLQIAASFKAN